MRYIPYSPQRLIFLLFCTLFSCGSFAIETFNIPPELNKQSLAKYLYYTSDSSISDNKTATIEQVLEASQNNLDWQRNPKDEALNLGFQFGYFWFRVDFSNPSSKSIEKLLNVSYPLLDVVDFYEIKNNKVINRSLQGNQVPFSNRIYEHRNFLYPITLEPGESLSMYMHIRGSAALQIPISIWDYKYFWQKDQWALGIQAIYVGLMLIMMCYHLFLAWGTRAKIYLLYVGILGSILTFLTCYYGVAHQFFWPNLTAWNGKAIAIAVPINNLMVLLFAMDILTMRKLAPKSNKLLKILAIILLFVAVGGATLPYHLMMPVVTGMVFITFTILLVICYQLWFKCETEGRIFTTAYSVYLFGSLSMALNKFGIIPATVWTESFVQIGSVVETILLSLALAARINRLREDSVKLIKAEVKTKEAELVAQQEINEGKAKTQFLAMMSHEIRTPMNGVLGLLDILKGTHLSGKQRYLVETIQSSGEMLLTIINDVLDFSKADADKLDLESIPIDPQQLIEECALLYSAKAKQKAIPLLTYISPSIPRSIHGDPTRLKQVVNNLLGNAFKFTEKGHVFLKAELLENSEGNRIRLEVRDTGIGISASQMSKLFSSFSQADSSTTRKFGGTGLGLAISKKIVEHMGGEIGVDSDPGKGSTFWIELPIEEAANPIKVAASRILVCSDYLQLGRLISESSQTLPISVKTISFDLLAEMLESPDHVEFDRCIIYNHDDSNLDSHQIASSLNAKFNKEIPIFIIELNLENTLDTTENNPTIVPPPVSLNALMGITFKHQTTTENTKANNQLPEEVSRLNILVAEDNQINQMVIKGILTPLVKSVKVVSDGKKALEEYSKHKEIYDLIFMDCEMPVMDGYESTRKIRTFEQQNNIEQPVPIVALTAHAFDQFKNKALDSGMNEHLAKPINSKLMVQFFNHFMKEHNLIAKGGDFDEQQLKGA